MVITYMHSIMLSNSIRFLIFIRMSENVLAVKSPFICTIFFFFFFVRLRIYNVGHKTDLFKQSLISSIQVTLVTTGDF